MNTKKINMAILKANINLKKIIAFDQHLKTEMSLDNGITELLAYIKNSDTSYFELLEPNQIEYILKALEQFWDLFDIDNEKANEFFAFLQNNYPTINIESLKNKANNTLLTSYSPIINEFLSAFALKDIKIDTIKSENELKNFYKENSLLFSIYFTDFKNLFRFIKEKKEYVSKTYSTQLKAIIEKADNKDELYNYIDKFINIDLKAVDSLTKFIALEILEAELSLKITDINILDEIFPLTIIQQAFVLTEQQIKAEQRKAFVGCYNDFCDGDQNSDGVNIDFTWDWTLIFYKLLQSDDFIEFLKTTTPQLMPNFEKIRHKAELIIEMCNLGEINFEVEVRDSSKQKTNIYALKFGESKHSSNSIVLEIKLIQSPGNDEVYMPNSLRTDDSANLPKIKGKPPIRVVYLESEAVTAYLTCIEPNMIAGSELENVPRIIL